SLSDITRVTSHPAAIAQCHGFLKAHSAITVEESYDTAGAARDLTACGDRTLAASAGPVAAERYGLAVLIDHVADRIENRTRFFALALRQRYLAGTCSYGWVCRFAANASLHDPLPILDIAPETNLGTAA